MYRNSPQNTSLRRHPDHQHAAHRLDLDSLNMNVAAVSRAGPRPGAEPPDDRAASQPQQDKREIALTDDCGVTALLLLPDDADLVGALFKGELTVADIKKITRQRWITRFRELKQGSERRR